MSGRITGFLVGAAVVLVAVGVAWFLSLERSVAQQIEREGSRLLGTRVTVGSVDLSLGSGTGTLRNLRVANPEGFSDADAFHLDEITLAIDTETLSLQPLRLDEVRVGQPFARLEVDARGATNLDSLLRHARSTPVGGSREPEGTDEPQRFAIGRLSFVGGELVLARPDAEPRQIVLPAFESRALSAEQGLTGGEIGQQVIGLIARRIAMATAREELGRVAEKLGDDVGKAARSVIDQVFD